MKCFFSLSANRCKTPPTRNNTIVSVSSTERLHGTSVLRNRVSMKVAYRVGSVLKYRCKRGFLLQVSLGPTARPASEQLRVTTRRVRIPLLENQHSQIKIMQNQRDFFVRNQRHLDLKHCVQVHKVETFYTLPKQQYVFNADLSNYFFSQ